MNKIINGNIPEEIKKLVGTKFFTVTWTTKDLSNRTGNFKINVVQEPLKGLSKKRENKKIYNLVNNGGFGYVDLDFEGNLFWRNTDPKEYLLAYETRKNGGQWRNICYNTIQEIKANSKTYKIKTIDNDTFRLMAIMEGDK